MASVNLAPRTYRSLPEGDHNVASPPSAPPPPASTTTPIIRTLAETRSRLTEGPPGKSRATALDVPTRGTDCIEAPHDGQVRSFASTSARQERHMRVVTRAPRARFSHSA